MKKLFVLLLVIYTKCVSSKVKLVSTNKAASPYGVVEVPSKWASFCSINYDFVAGSNFTAQWAFLLSCDMENDDDWFLEDYKQWITTNENSVFNRLNSNGRPPLFALKFNCRNHKGNISLPWPFTAKYMWSLSVKQCNIIDYLKEYTATIDIEDNLKVIELVDVTFYLDNYEFFEYMSNFGNVSDQFRCGGEQLEKFVKRNTSQVFYDGETHQPLLETQMIGVDGLETTGAENSVTERPLNKGALLPSDQLLSVDENAMLDSIAKFSQIHQHAQRQCSFDNLQYIDESFSTSLAKEHNYFMTEGSQFPGLNYYNLSHSKLVHLSPMLLSWRRYFPKMIYMDLSHNAIKYFTTFTDNGRITDGIGVLDLKFNNITTLTWDDLETIRLHSNTVSIDIRNNPLSCDCKFSKLITRMGNANTSSQDVLKKIYRYFDEMKCATPEVQRNKIVTELTDAFVCESLESIMFVGPIITLSVAVAVSLVGLVAVVTYRKEIQILAFTRLYIGIPCREHVDSDNCTYDAFIAYAEQDGSWVFNTLMPRLEEITDNGGPGFKLCIHHRDFPVGGCIADNISDKIKESNHTILILSNSFLQSQWCKFEFKTAFVQSMSQKKRHLIMIILEELDKRLTDTDLKRCLQTFTYVKKDDKLLWDKIVYALSHRGKPVTKMSTKEKLHKYDVKDI